MALVASSCDFVSKEGASYPFDVTVDVRDGLLNADGTLVQHPEVAFKITSEDPGAVYTMVYSIDNGETVTRENLVGSDVSVILNSDFDEFKDYGSHVLKGKITLDKDTNRAKAFTATVWMKYVPIVVSEMYFNGYDGRKTFKDKCVLNSESSGDFVIVYTPVESYSNIDIKCAPEGVLEFDMSEMKHEAGKFTIPYPVNGVGEPKVSLTFTNGPDVNAYTHEVDCREDDASNYFVPYWEAPAVILSGAEYSVSVGLSSGNIEKPYNVSFMLDGQEISSYSDVMFNRPVAYTLSADGLQPGEHSLVCEVSIQNGNSVELSQTVFVVPQELSFSGSDGTLISSFPGQVSILAIGESYSLRYNDVPADVLSSLEFVSNSESTIEGMMYHASARGENTLTVSACDGQGGTLDYSLVHKDKIVLECTIPDLVFTDEGIKISMKLLKGDASKNYKAEISFDGSPDTAFAFNFSNGSFEYELNDDHREGEHIVGVKVYSEDGFSTVWEKSSDVFIFHLMFTAWNDNESFTFDALAGHELEYSHQYKLAFPNMPVRFVDRFSVVAMTEGITCDKRNLGEGSVYWDVQANKFGVESLWVLYTNASDVQSKYIVKFPVNDNFSLSFTTDGKYLYAQVSGVDSFSTMGVQGSYTVSGYAWGSQSGDLEHIQSETTTLCDPMYCEIVCSNNSKQQLHTYVSIDAPANSVQGSWKSFEYEALRLVIYIRTEKDNMNKNQSFTQYHKCKLDFSGLEEHSPFNRDTYFNIVLKR